MLQQIFINFLLAVQFDRICFRRICADRLAEADVIKESGNVDITGFVPECRDKFAVGRDARFVKVAERQVQKVVCHHIAPLFRRQVRPHVDVDISIFRNTGQTSFCIQMGGLCSDVPIQLMEQCIFFQQTKAGLHSAVPGRLFFFAVIPASNVWHLFLLPVFQIRVNLF